MDDGINKQIKIILYISTLSKENNYLLSSYLNYAKYIKNTIKFRIIEIRVAATRYNFPPIKKLINSVIIVNVNTFYLTRT